MAICVQCLDRLVEVRDGSGETVKRYAYDGLHRRISETAGGVTTDFYYSDQWQVLEERVASGGTLVLRAHYVWPLVYVDTLILREGNINGDDCHVATMAEGVACNSL